MRRAGVARANLPGDRCSIADLELPRRQRQTPWIVLFEIDAHGKDVFGAEGALLMGAHLGSFEAMRACGHHFAGRDVATLLTQVVVDPRDEAFRNPTKPIGPFFTRYRAEALERDLGWTMREDAGRGWRHVVPSPRPLRILNISTIRHMLNASAVVIAAGGGGIPVVRGRDGHWASVNWPFIRA